CAANELNGDISRERGGDDVCPGVYPKDGEPSCDDFKQMRGSTRNDEEGEADDEEYPVARDDPAGFTSEVKERETDAGVAEKGDGVGDGHRPDEPLVLPPADCMGHQG